MKLPEGEWRELIPLPRSSAGRTPSAASSNSTWEAPWRAGLPWPSSYGVLDPSRTEPPASASRWQNEPVYPWSPWTAELPCRSCTPRHGCPASLAGDRDDGDQRGSAHPDPELLWWWDEREGSLAPRVERLTGRWIEGQRARAEGLVALVVEPLMAPLIGTTRRIECISLRVLWGNVASALAGAIPALRRIDPAAAGAVRSILPQVLAQPALMGTRRVRRGWRVSAAELLPLLPTPRRWLLRRLRPSGPARPHRSVHGMNPTVPGFMASLSVEGHDVLFTFADTRTPRHPSRA